MKRRTCFFLGLIFILSGCVRPPVENNAVFDDLTIGRVWNEAVWIDDWYAIQKIDNDTIIIGEPRSSQYNISYLLVGGNEAILFDAGSGERGKDVKQISEFIKDFTDKPIRVVLSHFHYDHTGGVDEFDGITMIDLPYIRERATNNTYPVSFWEHFNTPKPMLKIKDWVKHKEVIDLGKRKIQFLNAPGHAPESIVLIDHARKYAFAGDFVYQHLGGIVVFAPGSDLDNYVESFDELIKETDSGYRFFGAHGLPEFHQSWVYDVANELRKVNSGQARPILSSSTLLPYFPLRLHAKDQMLIYFTPFLTPAKFYSWPVATGLITVVFSIFGLVFFVIYKSISVLLKRTA